MTVKIALFDIDGTLVPHGSSLVPPGTVQALARLRQAGITVAVASGRIWPQIQPFIKALAFDDYVCANGHIVTDGQGSILADHPIPEPLIKELAAYCRRHGYPIGVKFSDDITIFASYRQAMESIFHNMVVTDMANLLVDGTNDLAKLDRRPSYNALVAIPDGQLTAVAAQLPRIRFDRIRANLYNAGLPDFTKADGITLLLQRLGLNWDETIIFGDAENDIVMLDKAGIAVAMGDGQPAAQKAADYVTGPCSGDGIADALTHFHLI